MPKLPFKYDRIPTLLKWEAVNDYEFFVANLPLKAIFNTDGTAELKYKEFIEIYNDQITFKECELNILKKANYGDFKCIV